LANDSKYPGERENALAAATRIAQKYNMTLDEAARWNPEDIAPGKNLAQQGSYQRPVKSSEVTNLVKNQQNAETE
jgi:LysM repeat protein